MENRTQDDLITHLLATDEHFRTLHEQHTEYSKLIDQIEARKLVTDGDELEEQRLKKLKLHAKDEMNDLLSRHRTATVS